MCQPRFPTLGKEGDGIRYAHLHYGDSRITRLTVRRLSKSTVTIPSADSCARLCQVSSWRTASSPLPDRGGADDQGVGELAAMTIDFPAEDRAFLHAH